MTKKIKLILKEASYPAPTYGASTRIGIHMGDDYRYGDMPTPKEDIPADSVYGESLPEPRTRISDIEDYKKVYAFLMGQPNASTNLPLSAIMNDTGANDPTSCAQAVADYLYDRAKIS